MSFVEIEQFQQWIMDAMSEMNGKTDESVSSGTHHEALNNVKLVEIHSDIPQSMFLESLEGKSLSDNDSLRNAKLVAFRLYEKYFKIGSKLEINISSGVRKELKNILSDKEKLMEQVDVKLNDLLLLFEKPKNEMRLLLKYSHIRFKRKAEYTKIVEMFAQTEVSHIRRISISIVNNL